MSKVVKIRKVHSSSAEWAARHFADNIHSNDFRELQAMGRYNDEAAHDALMNGVYGEHCFVASLEDDQGGQTWLAIGGYDPIGGSVWFITTKQVDDITKAERLRFGLALKGVMQGMMKAYPDVAFCNVVSIYNHSHIKLIKALGGKGFNTLYENVKSGSMFYPFYFINRTNKEP